MNKKLLKNFSKPTWEPIVEKKKGDLDSSKYFGMPWLSKNEDWPEIGGFPALFVMQLNIASLPQEMSKKLGGKGLIQFFYQPDLESEADYDENHLIRIVDNTQPSREIEQPLVIDYPMEGESIHEKVIVSWKEHVDYPHSEDYNDLNIDENTQTSLMEDDDTPFAIQGDKLGGWPFWTQAGGIDPSSLIVFQLDAGCFFDGKYFSAHAPNLFASDGTGHIIVSHENPKDIRFVWDCT